MSAMINRRAFMSLIGGAAASSVTWPLPARAQPGERVRRVGVLMNVAESDPEGQARLAVFVQRLRELGWIEGRNLRFDFRGGPGDGEVYRRYAAELIALSPDLIFANASVTVAALQQVTRTVPIVFASVIDPVGAGLVDSMARPGGNTTGFIAFE